MLMDFLYKFIATNCVEISIFYIWYKLNGKKNNVSIKRLIIYYFIICGLVTINYILFSDFIKTAIVTIILMIFYYLIYKDKIRKCVITPMFSQLIVMISELIFAFLLIVVFRQDVNNILFNFIGSIFSNICIAIISFGLIQFQFIKKIYNFIIEITDKIKERQLILLSLFFILVANILTAVIYYKVSITYLIITNTIIILIYSVIILFYFKTNNNYIKVYDKYNNTLNSLKEYESILDRYRVSNHENKNQLMTIRGMVKNKKIVSYIDEIVENKLKDNEKLMFESLIIPEGGLRGLIYSKLLLMKENNIEYDLCIDKNIKTTELTELDDQLVLNICNIIGVYLDNAIEEVSKLDEKYIVIEMYKDDTLNIAITNNYEGTIELDLLDNKGYTTKENGHGYGLSLVKEIIDDNKNITNVRRISDDEFTQEIKIKV